MIRYKVRLHFLRGQKTYRLRRYIIRRGRLFKICITYSAEAAVADKRSLLLIQSLCETVRHDVIDRQGRRIDRPGECCSMRHLRTRILCWHVCRGVAGGRRRRWSGLNNDRRAGRRSPRWLRRLKENAQITERTFLDGVADTGKDTIIGPIWISPLQVIRMLLRRFKQHRNRRVVERGLNFDFSVDICYRRSKGGRRTFGGTWRERRGIPGGPSICLRGESLPTICSASFAIAARLMGFIFVKLALSSVCVGGKDDTLVLRRRHSSHFIHPRLPNRLFPLMDLNQ